MELESSSSSFSKPKSQWTYDVFINFRGEDTRRSFVCHLNCALSKAGVKTFLDEENLHKGMKLDELMTAIEGSQIAIVVFSKSYTESTWCLRELEKVIECNETYGQSVLPVFYNIDPSVVRHRDEKHDFGKVLKSTAEKNYSGEHLENAFVQVEPRTQRSFKILWLGCEQVQVKSINIFSFLLYGLIKFLIPEFILKFSLNETYLSLCFFLTDDHYVCFIIIIFLINCFVIIVELEGMMLN